MMAAGAASVKNKLDLQYFAKQIFEPAVDGIN